VARIRTIKPEFWTNERVMECSVTARLLFIGLWNFADDLGRLHLSAKSIKAQVFPSDDIDSATILGMISELSRNGLVLIYAVEDREYLQITGWQHQRIDKPQAGKHPGPVEGYSKTIRGTFLPDRKGEERKGEDGIGKDSEADASGAEAPIDPRSDLFGRGLKTLATLTGKGPDACRSFVGKCLKAAGDDAVTVLGLIEDAERNRVIDASAWIAARLKATGPPAQRPMTEFQRGRNETKDILNDLGNFATGGSGRTTDSGVLSGDPGERPAGLRGGSGSNLVALPAAGGRAGG
jgi:hypothetical protein